MENTSTNVLTVATAQLQGVCDQIGAPAWSVPIISIVILLIATFLVNFIIKLVFGFIASRNEAKRTVISLVVVVLKCLVWLIFLTVCLTVLNVDFLPLLACLGVGGISMGIALKDPICGLIAGITLIVGEVFVIGDVINVGGQEGVVEEITIRYTKLLVDGTRVYIPNQNIVNSVVVLKKSARLPQQAA